MDVATNLGKYKAEIIYELVKSLNNGGNAGFVENCGAVEIAKKQYSKMVADGIIIERNGSEIGKWED